MTPWRISLTKSPLRPVKSQEERNLDVRPGIESRSVMFGLKIFQAEWKLSAGLVGCKMKWSWLHVVSLEHQETCGNQKCSIDQKVASDRHLVLIS